MFLLDKIFGDQSSRALRVYTSLVEKINALEKDMERLTDEALCAKTIEFKERLIKGETMDDILPEAFATVREATKRTLRLRPFDVQLIGGIVLHRGNIAEMKTGEGKTLVATMPAYLNALSGKGVHIVTVNDYLARRDTVWMGQIFSFLGLRVGVINGAGSYLYDPLHMDRDAQRDDVGSFKVVYEFLRPCSRQEAYGADVTYGTNSEFGFDYLRDNTALERTMLRQREHAYAIVDEIDSILIDEARTPLIISMPSVDSENLYVVFKNIVQNFTAGEDYEVDEKFKQITLKDSGIEKAEKALGVDNIYTDKGIKYVHHLETAVRAKALYQRDKEYVVRDGEVVIVDEFTGRMQPGRRWSEGLHQAVEAKEGVLVQKESRTAASITYQNYFRLYKKLSGMTGTALTSAEEFYKVYGLETIAIPTNKRVARVDLNDLILQTEQGKYQALAGVVKKINTTGQPILIGTVSIEKNEVLSAYLTKEGIIHEVLNAKNHENEGEIIAQAGRKGRVTVATNMAGRGVDIKLGGNPSTVQQYEEVKRLGGLYVIGTERHEARRIDNQLRGRSGRQGDTGTTQFFVSLEDSLMRVFARDSIKKLMGRFGIPEDQPIENKLITRSLEAAQTKIEGLHFDARKRILEYDDVLNHQRTSVYARRRKILIGTHEDIRVLLDELSLGNEALHSSIEQKKQTLGEQDFYTVVRRLFLQVTDMHWMEHLEVMDYMRSSVNLRAYGQRDPLVEYKKEGLRLFKDMQEAIADETSTLIPHIGAGAFAREEEQIKKAQAHAVLLGGGAAISAQSHVPKPTTASGEKLGRNDPCYCGSGKKYKKCHGA